MENPAGFPQPRARFAPLNVSMWKTLRCAPGFPHSDRRSAALIFNIDRMEIRMTVPKKTVHAAPDTPLTPLIHPLRHRFPAGRASGRGGLMEIRPPVPPPRVGHAPPLD